VDTSLSNKAYHWLTQQCEKYCVVCSVNSGALVDRVGHHCDQGGCFRCGEMTHFASRCLVKDWSDTCNSCGVVKRHGIREICCTRRDGRQTDIVRRALCEILRKKKITSSISVVTLREALGMGTETLQARISRLGSTYWGSELYDGGYLTVAAWIVIAVLDPCKERREVFTVWVSCVSRSADDTRCRASPSSRESVANCRGGDRHYPTARPRLEGNTHSTQLLIQHLHSS
jgi:hypothetical protein